MKHADDTGETDAQLAEWPIPVSAALGSSVRTEGIARELRARLPWPVRPALSVEAGKIALCMPAGAEGFAAAAATVGKVLEGIETLPVLPRETEDILAITAHERQKWTKDGRLQSAGTRTVKLRGRAKAVTFHVFDPCHIEDVLDRDLPAIWREEDAEAVAEARRRAARKAALTRAGDGAPKPSKRSSDSKTREMPKLALAGWEAFEADGLLR